MKSRKIKPQKHMSRHSALLSTTVALTTILDYFNIFGDAQLKGCKLQINNNTPGATFSVYTTTNMTCSMANAFAYNAAFSPPESHLQ